VRRCVAVDIGSGIVDRHSKEESERCRFRIQQAQIQPRGESNACGRTAAKRMKRLRMIDKTQSIANCIIWREKFDELASESMEEKKRCRSQIQHVQIQPRGNRNTCRQTVTNGGNSE